MKNTPNRVLWAVLAFLTLSACESAEGGAKADEVKQPALNTAIEKGSYALGYRYAEGLNQQTFGVMDTEAFLAGARAALSACRK